MILYVLKKTHICLILGHKSSSKALGSICSLNFTAQYAIIPRLFEVAVINILFRVGNELFFNRI